MTLTQDELETRRELLRKRTARFKELDLDPLLVPGFVLDGAGSFEGPVLDLGTGNGVMARELARRGFWVESVDVSAEEQEVAAFLTDEPALACCIRFTRVDGKAFPFPDGHFGCAVTMNALHHLADGATALAELMRVVRPGATIVLADFSSEGFATATRIHAAEGNVHPEGPVTLDWARGFLKGLGAFEMNLREGCRTRVATLRKAEAGKEPPAFAALDRAGLFKALDVFAKNWLAHDGSWFLATERRFGMEAAMDLDSASWDLFAAAEARRIMDAFSIPGQGGLDALERALTLRMYSFINPYRLERSPDGSVLRFFMEACRVQETRHRKGLPDFPCKPVGQVEFSMFARTVDARIRTVCLHCPPDSEAHGHCGWEFRLSEKKDLLE